MRYRSCFPFTITRYLLAVAMLASLVSCGDAGVEPEATGAAEPAAVTKEGTVSLIAEKSPRNRWFRNWNSAQQTVTKTAALSTTTTIPAVATPVTTAPAPTSPAAATPTTTATAETAVVVTKPVTTTPVESTSATVVAKSTAPTAPSAGTTAAQKSSLNSVDTIISDMVLASDFSPPGYSNSFATLNNPRPAVTPFYRLQGMAMDSIIAWLVIGRGPGDKSTNTRVEARNEKVYVLYSNGTWTLATSGRPTGRQRSNNPFADSGAGDEIQVDATTTSLSAPMGYLQEMWSGLAHFNNFTDVIGFFATADVRLVTANSAMPDDRAVAKWSAQIGCDWWNYAGSSTGNFMMYDNAGGSGRFKQITNDWQPVSAISMKGWMTSNKGPPEDPSWTADNPYQWPNDASHPQGAALSEAYVRANPPPF